MIDGSPVGHRPGQFVDIIVPTPRGIPFKRAYSIASAPDALARDRFEIAVTRVEGGPTSEALHTLAPGARVEVDGPEGTFLRRREDQAHPALFIATGTGLAPFRAMLAQEVPESEGPPLVLLFGCRTPHDVLWGEELLAWEQGCPRFRLHVTLSRPPPEWAGLSGYVQRHSLALAAARTELHVYVCGVSAMVDEVVQLLEHDAALPRSAIHYETYD